MGSVQKEVQTKTIVTLKNSNKRATGKVQLDRYHNWQGKPLGGSFPETIPPQGVAQFIHEKGDQPSSMAAVQYSGPGKAGETLAVIVAWDAPGQYDPPNVPNRAYVVGGSKSSIDRLSWEEILLRLEKASFWSYMVYVDASIEHNSPNSATLDSLIRLESLGHE